MAGTNQPSIKIPDLHTSLDQLATRLVIDGLTADVQTELKQFSQLAQQSGLYEIATDALLLCNLIDSCTSDNEASRQADMSGGLTRLAEALQRESRESSQSNRMPDAAAATPASKTLAADPELVHDFITESREHLAAIESGLLALEANGETKESLNAIFRGFHTIKGLAGFLEFLAIGEVAHEVETVLDSVRNGKLLITSVIIDSVLEAADYLKAALANIEAELRGRSAKTLRDVSIVTGRVRDAARNNVPVAPEPSAQVEAKEPAKPAGAPEGDNFRMGEAFTIRVETNKLERLMDAVGELMVAQSAIRRTFEDVGSDNSELAIVLSRLNRITADVQRSAMSMRMVPVGQLFGRSARLVRDISRKLCKKVQYISTGESTEVDKTIAEELSDPLLHMMRNAIDHGVELPEERVLAGKDPTAQVRLAAYHQGAEIVIEISDDGRGLDRDQIFTKAIERGLVSPDANLTGNEVFNLIFEPGFSTAAQVTDLSGRGVGMDVVRKNLTKLRGRIDIESKLGKGTTFYLRMPLTLAIIEGLVVTAGTQRFVVPAFTVAELIQVTPEMISTIRGRHEIALIRGELVPIVRLAQRLGIKGTTDDLAKGLLIVTGHEGAKTGVWVEHLLGREEVVIKSLGESLKDLKNISGCAVLGDGCLGLILDMTAICAGGY